MTVTDIPDVPDIARMRRETGQKLRAAMARHGVDVLVLIGNSKVSYATGVSWPLGDSGLAHVDRPVAVMLADDPEPHLFMPFREGAGPGAELAAGHLHDPVYLEYDEGAELFAAQLAELVPAGAVIAVDELTGAMRRIQHRLFPGGLVDAGRIVSDGQGDQDRRRAGLHAAGPADHRGGHRRRRTGGGARRPPGGPVRPVRPPRVRTGRDRQRARPDLAGDAAKPGGRRLDHPR